MTPLATAWARIMAPLAGGKGDVETLAAAAALAAPFDAEVAVVHAPADVADLLPWIGDGFTGGAPMEALVSLQQAAKAGRKAARAAFDASAYGRKTFIPLDSPVWPALSMLSRLSDVVVFGSDAARGVGPLAEAFQQMVAGEQRPVLVARPGLDIAGVTAVAWDGGKEASRAMRTALPLLQQASQVHILSCCASSPRDFDPEALKAFLAARGVAAQVTLIPTGGEVGAQLLKAARDVGASLFVAGAYGHPRLQEFIFGSATKVFLQAPSPSLFLSH
jgi:nucleotide-binding universal stress UspA family protein